MRTTSADGTLSDWNMPNPWARISDVAARVGVDPIGPGHPATICATGADGKNYDIWEVVIGILDAISTQTES